MNQSFNLKIAPETLESDARQLGVTIDELQRICVKVNATIVRQPVLQLQLAYQVTLPNQILANQLTWPTWQQGRVAFTDYLWEETCLECFIGASVSNQETAPYIEINASPDGRYALYTFRSYRSPATLPPTPLYNADGHTRAAIDWADHEEQPVPSIENELSISHSPYCYERSIGIALIELPDQRYVIADMIIEQIHPCVILQFGKCTLYFASSHASPPDFHNRDYWPKFEL